MNSRSFPPPPFPASPSSEAAMLAQTADSQRWFVEEVQPHDAHLKAYLRSAFPSVNDVEDVVQESYLRLWRTRATQQVRSAKAFLFRVARNIAIDVLRQRRRLPRLGDFVAERVLEEKPSAAEAAGEREKMILLADAVLALPARCREIVVLRKIHGLSQKDVAGRLGLSERTVENQCRLGIRRCEAYLRAHGMSNYLGDER